MSAAGKSVAFADLVLDEQCQSRADISHDTVEDYREAYAAKVKLPPLEVYDVGGALYVVDGFHRAAAAAAAGVAFLRVVVVGEGAIEEAIWHASGANTKHGLRRSNADKRKAVWSALSSLGMEFSSRVVAEHVGVSDMLVGKIRREWEASQVQTVCTSTESVNDAQVQTVCTSEPAQVATNATSEKSADDAQVQTDCTSEADQLRQSRTSEPQTRKGRDGKSYRVKPAPAAPESPVTVTPMPDVEPLYMAVIKAVQEARRASVPIRAIDASLGERVKALLHEAEHAIRYRIPAVCSKCGGGGCVACSHRGWVESGATK